MLFSNYPGEMVNVLSRCCGSLVNIELEHLLVSEIDERNEEKRETERAFAIDAHVEEIIQV